MTDLETGFVRGHLWSVDFAKRDGTQAGTDVRPALIVSDDRLHHPNLGIVIVIPGTATIQPLPLHVSLEPNDSTGLAETTSFEIERLQAVQFEQFIERLGRPDPVTAYNIDLILRNALRL